MDGSLPSGIMFSSIQLALEHRALPPEDSCWNLSSLLFYSTCYKNTELFISFHPCSNILCIGRLFSDHLFSPYQSFQDKTNPFFQACRLILKFSFLSSGYSLIDPHLAWRVVSCQKLISPEEKITAWTQHSRLQNSE